MFNPRLHPLKIFTRFYAHGIFDHVLKHQLKLNELK